MKTGIESIKSVFEAAKELQQNTLGNVKTELLKNMLDEALEQYLHLFKTKVI